MTETMERTTLAQPNEVDDQRPDPPAPNAKPSLGRVKRRTHLWARRIHIYSSMVALIIVLFFGITGITLNHPDWTFGDEVSVQTFSGEFSFDVVAAHDAVDYLAIAEYARSEYGVNGSVDSYGVTNGTGSIAIRNPGYSADIFFDVETGTYDLTVNQEGFVAVMNDLHKGRDASSLWKWVIDISAGFLVLISLSGLAMQFFLRKRRRSALTTMVVGGVAVVVLIWVTLA